MTQLARNANTGKLYRGSVGKLCRGCCSQYVASPCEYCSGDTPVYYNIYVDWQTNADCDSCGLTRFFYQPFNFVSSYAKLYGVKPNSFSGGESFNITVPPVSPVAGCSYMKDYSISELNIPLIELYGDASCSSLSQTIYAETERYYIGLNATGVFVFVAAISGPFTILGRTIPNYTVYSLYGVKTITPSPFDCYDIDVDHDYASCVRSNTGNVTYIGQSGITAYLTGHGIA